MSTSDSRREHPNTYAVQDRSNEEEMKRLHLQDRLVNKVMGSLLPEQVDPARLRRVLDVGCGTGGWLIELAKAHPTISKLVGVDVSGRMLDFARAQAAAEGVSDRVEFLLMDALRMLEFPNAFFDLVNHRFGSSWLRIWDWSKLLQEYRRVVRSDGLIRITEGNWVMESSSSPALLQLSNLALQAFYQAGHSFQPTSEGVTGELAGLLRRHDVREVQTRVYAVEYRADKPEGRLFAEDAAHVFRTFQPFLRKWVRLPDDYEEIYQRMVKETNEPTFVAKMNMLSAWGTRI